MARIQDQVREFHKTFDVPSPSKPETPSPERIKLRVRLISEEFFEFLYAVYGNEDGKVFSAQKMIEQIISGNELSVDFIETLDAMADLNYVVEGSFQEFGVESEAIQNEVHRSNMSKFPASKRADGKIMKNPNWSPPDLEKELFKQGWKKNNP